MFLPKYTKTLGNMKYYRYERWDSLEITTIEIVARICYLPIILKKSTVVKQLLRYTYVLHITRTPTHRTHTRTRGRMGRYIFFNSYWKNSFVNGFCHGYQLTISLANVILRRPPYTKTHLLAVDMFYSIFIWL